MSNIDITDPRVKCHVNEKGDQILRLWKLPADHFLNCPPTASFDEDGDPVDMSPEWWFKARCEYLAYDEQAKMDIEAAQALNRLKQELNQIVTTNSLSIGSGWNTALLLKLESGADPLIAYERVLAGIYCDQECSIALISSYQYGERQDDYDALVDWESIQLRWRTERNLEMAEDAIRAHFMEFMTNKGPRDAKGNRREPIGVATATAEWQKIVTSAAGATDNIPDDYATTRVIAGRVQPVDLSDPAKVRSTGEASLIASKVPEPILDGLINADSVTYVVGQFGTYKTFALVGWALAVASGKPWCGHLVPKAGPVLYVAAEGRTGLRDRLLAARDFLGLKEAQSNLGFYDPALQLGDVDSVDELIAEAKRFGSKLIILDTLHKVSAGLDTMGDGGAGVVAAALDKIRRETGAAIVVAHHTGYAGEHARGSSALEDDADMVWLIKKKGTERVLTQRKNRDGAEAAPSKLAFNSSGKSGYVTLAEVDDRLSLDDIVDLFDDEDLPDDASERMCRDALIGQKFVRTDLRAAMDVRKNRVVD